MNTKMGYQLSSIAPYLDTQQNIRESFKKLSEIGYCDVQLQGVPMKIEDLAISEALKEAGLNCVATQEDYPFGFGENPERSIARAVQCGAEYLSFALIPRGINSISTLEDFAVKVNKIAEKVQKEGMIFAFHPIGYDFRNIDGRPVYERLLDLLPRSVKLTFCVSAAHSEDVDPLSILKKYTGRIDLVHFKDDAPISGGKRHLVPLGQGTHDWAPILEACNRAGVQYVFAEQESWTKDAFECAMDSYDYLKSLGL
jgi:Xylose isomerase-like TIM barrel.